MSDSTHELHLPRSTATQRAAPERSTLRHVFRLLNRFVAGQRRLFLMALILLIIEAVTAVFEAYPLAYLIDFLKGDRPDLSTRLGLPTVVTPLLDTIGVLTIAIVLLAMINSLADSLAEIFLAKGGRILGFNLRVTLYAHLQRLSLAFHDQRRTGDILTRVTSDVTALEDFVISSLSDIAGSLLVLIGTLAYLTYNSWQVALVAVLIVPIMAGVSNYFSQKIKVASKKQRAREGDLASSAQEMLASIRVIQTYSRAGYEQQRFAEHSGKAMGAALEVAGVQARFSWVVKVLEAVAIAVVVWLGLWLIDRTAITVGTLVLFIILIQNMFKPTRKIIKEWNRIGKIYASVERIGELLDRQPAVTDAPDAVEAPPFAGRVELRHVSFAYQPDLDDSADVRAAQAPARLALRDVSFSVNPGEVLALVGHTGAGKSTIAQLLPRLYDPHNGQIVIDGADIRRFTIESLRSQISAVLQETILFSGSVADNIVYGRTEATRDEIITAAKQANAHEFIEKLPDGYDTLLGERGANLSGGQRQRIAIARAFIRNAPILILDEPTTGLDAESTELVLAALRMLMQGKTTIIISHDFGLIRHADTIVVLKQGAIEEVGGHSALLEANGIYASLYRKQFGPPDLAPVAAPAPEPAESFDALLAEELPEPATAETFDRLITDQAETPAADAEVAPDEGAPALNIRPLQAVDRDPRFSSVLQQEFPALATAFDETAMRDHLQAALFGADAHYTIERCSPGKAVLLDDGCRLRYAIEVKDNSGQVWNGLALARLFADRRAAAAYLHENVLPLGEQMQGRDEIAPFVSPAALLPALNMVVAVCPLDGDLPWLLGATDRRRMTDVFRAALPEAQEGAFTVEDCRLELGHYGRQHRCVVRYEIDGSAIGSATPLHRVVYGKVAHDDRGARVGPALAALRAAMEQRSTAFRFMLPDALGYVSDLHLALLGAIPGTPRISRLLKAWLLDAHPGERESLTLEHALEISAQIAGVLHSSNIAEGRRRSANDELAQLRHAIAEVQRIAPALGAQLRNRLEQVAACAESSEPLPLRFSHGDFTYTQIMFDGTTGGLVDFDTMCQAEPALDLGQFLAYLRVAARKSQGSASDTSVERIEQLPARFLQTYVANRQGEITDQQQFRSRVALYEGISLLRMAVHSWQKFKADRLAIVLDVLDERAAQLQQPRVEPIVGGASLHDQQPDAPAANAVAPPTEALPNVRSSNRRAVLRRVAWLFMLGSIAPLIALGYVFWQGVQRAEQTTATNPVPGAASVPLAGEASPATTAQTATISPIAAQIVAPTGEPGATPTTAPTAQPSATPTAEQNTAALLHAQVISAEDQLRTGQFNAVLDYGDNNRAVADMRFDLGDAQRPARFAITTRYEGAAAAQTTEQIMIGNQLWQRQGAGRWAALPAQEGAWGQVQGMLPRAKDAADIRLNSSAPSVELAWYDAARNANITLSVDPQTGTPRSLRRVTRANGLTLTVTYTGWNTPVEIAAPVQR